MYAPKKYARKIWEALKKKNAKVRIMTTRVMLGHGSALLGPAGPDPVH
jgi:hypothetical protein